VSTFTTPPPPAIVLWSRAVPSDLNELLNAWSGAGGVARDLSSCNRGLEPGGAVILERAVEGLVGA